MSRGGETIGAQQHEMAAAAKEREGGLEGSVCEKNTRAGREKASNCNVEVTGGNLTRNGWYLKWNKTLLFMFTTSVTYIHAIGVFTQGSRTKGGNVLSLVSRISFGGRGGISIKNQVVSRLFIRLR